MTLKKVFCIYYSIWFKKDKVRALIDFRKKINIMIPAYELKLGLKTYHINVEIKKIDNSTFKNFKMVLASFQVENKFEKICFFQKIFLLTNINAKVVLKIYFLIFSNAKI